MVARRVLRVRQALALHQHAVSLLHVDGDVSGTLHLRNALSKVGHDEQVYNGAGYTNWGFGVPALQMPFHAVAARTPILLEAFPPASFRSRHLLLLPGGTIPSSGRPSIGCWPCVRARRRALAAARALLVGVAPRSIPALYPLTSCRFFVYQDTIAYLVVSSCWPSGRTSSRCGRGAPPPWWDGGSRRRGAPVRPTGLVWLGCWRRWWCWRVAGRRASPSSPRRSRHFCWPGRTATGPGAAPSSPSACRTRCPSPSITRRWSASAAPARTPRSISSRRRGASFVRSSWPFPRTPPIPSPG